MKEFCPVPLFGQFFKHLLESFSNNPLLIWIKQFYLFGHLAQHFYHRPVPPDGAVSGSHYAPPSPKTQSGIILCLAFRALPASIKVLRRRRESDLLAAPDAPDPAGAPRRR